MTISHAEYLMMLQRVSKQNPQAEHPTACDDESELHQQILDYCKQQSPPWLAYHGEMAHKTYRTPGEQDFTILLPQGRVLMIECKKRGEKPTTEQRNVIYWAGMLGHKIHVVYSFEEFKTLL